MFQLQNLEEEKISPIHHQEVQKKHQKTWHDGNIRTKHISAGDLVLLYDNKIKRKPRKLEIAWLGPYIIEKFNTNGTIRLKNIQGWVFTKVVNGPWPKWYHP